MERNIVAKAKKPVGKKKVASKGKIKCATTKRRTAVVARKAKWSPGASMYMAIHPSDEPLPLNLIGKDYPREAIARRAYELWEERVRIANDAARNWFDAEAEFRIY
jgi:hypothetical protein